MHPSSVFDPKNKALQEAELRDHQRFGNRSIDYKENDFSINSNDHIGNMSKPGNTTQSYSEATSVSYQSSPNKKGKDPKKLESDEGLMPTIDETNNSSRRNDSSRSVLETLEEEKLSLERQLEIMTSKFLSTEDFLKSLKEQLNFKEEQLQVVTQANEEKLMELEKMRIVKESNDEEIAQLKKDITSKNDLISRNEFVKEKLHSMELFKIQLGKIITHQYEEFEDASLKTGPIDLDSEFQESFPNISGFITFEDEDKLKIIMEENTKLKEENEKLKEENKKLKEENKQIVQEFSKNITEKLETIPADISKQIADLTLNNERKDNEKIIDEYKILSNKLEKYESMNISLTNIHDELTDTQKKLVETERELINEQSYVESLKLELSSLKGIESEPLTYETLKMPHITKERFDSLKVHLIDNYDLAHLKRIVKMACIHFNLSPNSLELNIPVLAVIRVLFCQLLEHTSWFCDTVLDFDIDLDGKVKEYINIYNGTGEIIKASRAFNKILKNIKKLTEEELEITYADDDDDEI
ncbi:hypothetical protein MOUN0_O13212 [Monosporozyma unispora]